MKSFGSACVPLSMRSTPIPSDGPVKSLSFFSRINVPVLLSAFVNPSENQFAFVLVTCRFVAGLGSVGRTTTSHVAVAAA